MRIGLIFLGVTLFLLPSFTNAQENQVEIYEVTQALESCADSTSIIECATPQVQKLLSGRTGAEVMQLLQLYAPLSCHTIGHVVGREVYAREGSIEGALSDCEYGCGGACNHGITGAAFLSQSGVTLDSLDEVHIDSRLIQEVGKQVCSVSDGCHGVGHILFQIYNSFDEPLSLCDEIGRLLKREDCYWGIFMEHADRVSSHDTVHRDDKQFVADTKDILFPCTDVEQKYRHACFRYLSRIQDRIFDETGTGVERRYTLRTLACETFISGEDRSSCFEGLGRYILDTAILSPYEAYLKCGSLESGLDRMSCSRGLIHSLVAYKHVDKAWAYCREIKNPFERAHCSLTVFGTHVFIRVK